MMDAIPLRASSHSPEMYFRSRTAAAISKAPVTNAHAAINTTKAKAVMPGHRIVITAATIPAIPSNTSTPQRSCAPRSFPGADETHHAVNQGISAKQYHQGGQCNSRPNKGDDAQDERHQATNYE